MNSFTCWQIRSGLAGVMGALLVLLSATLPRFVRYFGAAMRNNGLGEFPTEGDGVAPVFPTVVGMNLEGRRFELPRDFDGEYAIVVLAYEQWQQSWVDTWIPLLTALESASGGRVTYYELPTLGEYAPPFRAYIDSAMAAGIPDPKARSRTITLYLDQRAFNQRLQIGSTKTTHTLLLDGEGRVVWRAEGPLTDEAGRELRRQLPLRLA